MFNLIVGGPVNSEWRGGEITGWGGRFLLQSEGTAEQVLSKIQTSDEPNWRLLESLPALITPEKQAMKGAHGAMVGTLSGLRRVPGGDVFARFARHPDVPKLGEDQVTTLLDRLHAGELWHYRTHWAVHDGDLFEGLLVSGILGGNLVGPSGGADQGTRPQRTDLASEIESVVTTSESPGEKRAVSEAGRVFLVHGHNEARKHELGRFIRALVSSDPIILHEQANGGMTIIEKFEHYAGNSGFAVALMTADDWGRANTSDEDQPRARQNVVFEAGYFTGRLGRKRVVLLHDQDVELPSDLGGIVYIPLDSGAWRTSLARELSDAGFEVDWRALGNY